MPASEGSPWRPFSPFVPYHARSFAPCQAYLADAKLIVIQQSGRSFLGTHRAAYVLGRSRKQFKRPTYRICRDYFTGSGCTQISWRFSPRWGLLFCWSAASSAPTAPAAKKTISSNVTKSSAPRRARTSFQSDGCVCRLRPLRARPVRALALRPPPQCSELQPRSASMARKTTSPVTVSAASRHVQNPMRLKGRNRVPSCPVRVNPF